MTFSALGLCSGIGCAELAVESVGGTTVALAENAEFPAKVLAKRFRGVPNLGDIHDVTAQSVREAIMPASKLTDEQFEQAIYDYLENGLSIGQIADHLPISRQSLWERFKRRGVPMRDQARFGEDNHFYRGGVRGSDWAQNKVEWAISSGHLKRPSTCSKCGGEGTPYKDGRARIQAHHDDYNKPLEVRWLCKLCHHEWHKNHEPISLREEVMPSGSPDLIVAGFP